MLLHEKDRNGNGLTFPNMWIGSTRDVVLSLRLSERRGSWKEIEQISPASPSNIS